MKIGYDAKRAFHNTTGLGNYSRSLIRSVQSVAPQNAYWLFNPKPNARFDSFFNPSISHVVTPSNALLKVAHPVWRTYRIGALVKEKKLDIYHGLSGELPASLPKDTLKVVTIHDTIFISKPELYKAVDRKMYTKKLQHGVETANLVIATSEFTKKDILKYTDVAEEKVHVVYQSCDEAFFEAGKTPRPVDEKPYFLCVGTIEPRKNQATLIKALASVSSGALKLVGRATSYQNELEQLANKLGVSERVEFINNASSSELSTLYHNALAFTYASTYEGFGIPLLEAQAAGCPVISSNASCLPEVAGPHSALLEPTDVKGFSSNMQEFLDNPSIRQQKSSEAITFAAQFKAEALAEQMLALYSLK